jgi:hypothetical protein
MIRRVFSTAALVSTLVAAPLLVPTSASAIPVCKAGFECERVYYSNATHDTVVGGFVRSCDGTVTTWGETTVYQVTTQAQC